MSKASLQASRKRDKKHATVRAERYAHRIQGLALNIQTLAAELVADTDKIDYGTVGSLAHVEQHLAEILMTFKVGAGGDEDEVTNEILASVDPEGKARF